MNFKGYHRGFQITITIMFSLVSMAVLYFVRLSSSWMALPFMALAGIPLSGISAEEDFFLSFFSYVGVQIFALGLVGGYVFLSPYVVFFGLYPLIKPLFDMRGDSFLRWMLKIVYFSVAALVIMQTSATTVLVPYMDRLPPYLLLGLCYVSFILYDYLLWLFALFYVRTIRRRL